MNRHRLSPEIVSLVHHVELNESGWWKKAVGQVVKGVLWKPKTSQTLVEVHEALRRELGIVFKTPCLRPGTDQLYQRSIGT